VLSIYLSIDIFRQSLLRIPNRLLLYTLLGAVVAASLFKRNKRFLGEISHP
jgi:hypothetical protein